VAPFRLSAAAARVPRWLSPRLETKTSRPNSDGWVAGLPGRRAAGGMEAGGSGGSLAGKMPDLNPAHEFLKSGNPA
jgi:hypothetical protein